MEPCNACGCEAKRAGVSAGVLDGVPVRMPVPVRVVRIIHGRPSVLLRKGGELADCAIGMLTVMIKQQEEREA